MVFGCFEDQAYPINELQSFNYLHNTELEKNILYAAAIYAFTSVYIQQEKAREYSYGAVWGASNY